MHYEQPDISKIEYTNKMFRYFGSTIQCSTNLCRIYYICMASYRFYTSEQQVSPHFRSERMEVSLLLQFPVDNFLIQLLCSSYLHANLSMTTKYKNILCLNISQHNFKVMIYYFFNLQEIETFNNIYCNYKIIFTFIHLSVDLVTP